MKSKNKMADQSITCQYLQEFYNLPTKIKEKYIKTDCALELLQQIPDEISGVLTDYFLNGTSLYNNGGAAVVDYFNSHSDIIPELKKNPGTYTMLERMYGFESIHFPIDVYFSKSVPGGIALNSRYHKVNEIASRHIKDILKYQNKCIVIDLGSGPGRNGIDLTLQNEEFAERVEFHCVDIDAEAITYGKKLVEKYKLKNIKFVDKSMTRLHKLYRNNVDYGLIIGVLCGLTLNERTGLLNIVKPYFKKGSKVIGAGLLKTMLEEDFFCSYILKETAGWLLQHPPLGIIEESFLKAGYDYDGFEQEEPSRCYEIGIGIAI